MRPSNTYFPTNLAARAAWFANFRTQFVTTYAALLGLGAFVSQVKADDNDFQSIAATRLAVENFKGAVAEFLRELTESPVGSPQPVFPAETFAAPPDNVPAGIFQRLDELRTLIMAQPAYTTAMGSAMGIEVSGSSGEGIAPELAKPEIDVFAAAVGYMFSIVITQRHGTTQSQVWTAPVGTTDWALTATVEGKSSDIHYTPVGEDAVPIQLQVRVQLRKSNANFGQPSDITLVTLNP